MEDLYNDWVKDSIIQDVDTLSENDIKQELKSSNYYDESYLKLIDSIEDLKSLLIDVRFEQECR